MKTQFNMSRQRDSESRLAPLSPLFKVGRIGNESRYLLIQHTDPSYCINMPKEEIRTERRSVFLFYGFSNDTVSILLQV